MEIDDYLYNKIRKSAHGRISVSPTTARFRLPIHQVNDRSILATIERDLHLTHIGIITYSFNPAEFQ